MNESKTKFWIGAIAFLVGVALACTFFLIRGSDTQSLVDQLDRENQIAYEGIECLRAEAEDTSQRIAGIRDEAASIGDGIGSAADEAADIAEGIARSVRVLTELTIYFERSAQILEGISPQKPDQ